MTAEVAVLNRIGVALAADSAVTIGREADKIYTSAEKLFQLSASAPIGIMVYGNADLCGLSWETVIKTYRQRNGSVEFESVGDCAEHFVNFLAAARDLFPTERQEEHARRILAGLLLFVRDELRERLDDEAEKREGLTDAELPPIIDEVFRNQLELVEQRDVLPGFENHTREAIAGLIDNDVSQLIEAVFGNLPISASAHELLVSICSETIRRHFFGPS